MNTVSKKKSFITYHYSFYYYDWVFLESSASSWNINCSPSGNQTSSECTMQQEIIMRNSQLPVLQLTFAKLSEETPPHALLIVPLGIYLPGRVVIQIDDNPGKTLSR